LTGLLQQALPDGFVYHEFRYNVVRTWERPAEEILRGGLGTLPLAPLGKVDEDELPAVIQTIRQRLDREATRNQAQTLWTSTYLLMGLRYPESFIVRLLEGVENMTESVTYQKILREGRAEGRAEGRTEEARRILKRLAARRLGDPSPEFDAVIDAIADLERLELLTDRVLDASSWQELIGATEKPTDRGE
jgi:predicted transposase YdaD